jgi:hypothetical protein
MGGMGEGMIISLSACNDCKSSRRVVVIVRRREGERKKKRRRKKEVGSTV